MSVLNILFDILGPVALLVAIGAVVGPRLGIDVGSLSRLAYWVFGPAFAFGLLVDADIPAGTVVRLAAAALAGMAAALVVAVVPEVLAAAAVLALASTQMDHSITEFLAVLAVLAAWVALVEMAVLVARAA